MPTYVQTSRYGGEVTHYIPPGHLDRIRFEYPYSDSIRFTDMRNWVDVLGLPEPPTINSRAAFNTWMDTLPLLGRRQLQWQMCLHHSSIADAGINDLTMATEPESIRCYHCSAWRPETAYDRPLVIRTGVRVCDRCASNSFYCEPCAEWTFDSSDCASCSPWDGNLDSDDDDDEPHEYQRWCDCYACQQYRDYGRNNGDEPRGILSYSYKPTPRFHGDGPVYLGPEIELEFGGNSYSVYEKLQQIAYSVNDAIGNLGYVKSDGSLDSGMEIVTHPMSYDYAIDNFPWPMLAELKKQGMQASSRTGVHIHVSRAGFSNPSHVFRWHQFIHHNAAMVQKIAGRGSVGYSKYDADQARKSAKFVAKGYPVTYVPSGKPVPRRRTVDNFNRDANQKVGHVDRYLAINVLNEHTFELRIFQSTTNADVLKSYFALADASVEYTRQLDFGKISKDKGWSWAKFAEWLALPAQAKYAPLRDRL